MTSIRHTESDPLDVADPLLLAARDVILTHGPRRATLTEIARQAGVSRMTVYRRFESLDRLVAALLTAEFAQLLTSVPVADSGNARQRATRLIGSITAGLADHELLRRILAVDPESLVPLMVRRYGQTQRTALELLVPLLREGMTSCDGDGSIRDEDPHALALLIVTTAQGLIFAAPALADAPAGDAARDLWPTLIDNLLRKDS